ncbi:hypothetical protein [Mycolicibacterium baixiangningiae]|uniref:hypothetical protein n=1 Tax=Mycolicibacterium baixiangningiae TaxID=2761578 RepID=UPI0018662B40|nr:hypothetical protein [Mycolicibacterium baixiangningiae]
MTALERLNGLDSRAWRTATWSAPFVTQGVLALIIVVSWLLGRWLDAADDVILFMLSAAVAFVVCAVLCGALTRSASSRARGLAMSVAGSFAAVLVGGLMYGFWILAW